MNAPQYPVGPSPTGLSRRRMVAGIAALQLVVLATVLWVGPFRREPGAGEDRAALQARVTALETQLGLAEEDARYLLVDPERGTLTLYHGGTVLRSWPVLEVEAGARRLGADPEGDWRTRRWDGARMEPPVERERRVIVSDSVAGEPDLTAAEEWIPPTPEEAVPTPPRFVVHYEGGMGLEVLAVEGDSAQAGPGMGEGLEHRVLRLLPRNWDRYRIRVRMDAVEAGRLYRSLPDSTSLVALIPRR